MVERAAHNGFAVGSIPTRLITKPTSYFYMDFNFKAYQRIKLKRYFKDNSLFFLFHSAKPNAVRWRSIEQSLKKLKLNYSKPSKKITTKVLKKSIYKNFISNIAGFVLFVCSSAKDNKMNLIQVTKILKSLFALSSLKLNDKIYPVTQLRGLDSLSHKKSVFTFYKVLDKKLKTSYILTNQKKTSK